MGNLSELTNKQLLILGLIFLLMSILGFIFSFNNLSSPLQNNDIDSIGSDTMLECFANIDSQFGNEYNVSADNVSLTVNITHRNISGIDNIKDMDIMLNMCPNMKLKYFCSGTDCGSSSNSNLIPLEMELKFNRPTEQ